MTLYNVMRKQFSFLITPLEVIYFTAQTYLKPSKQKLIVPLQTGGTEFFANQKFVERTEFGNRPECCGHRKYLQ